MKIIYLLLLISFSTSCAYKNYVTDKENTSDSSNEAEELIPQIDSTETWVSVDYLNSMEENISICDCWRLNRYQLLYFDTIRMELYLKSNFMHFGHDSEFILPIKKKGNGYIYDSTLNDWPISTKEFEFYSKDTLILIEENKSYKFIKKSFQSKGNSSTSKTKRIDYYEFVNLFYRYNSHILLKYNTIVTEKSTKELISPDALKVLILKGLVTGYCSDDYYYDGITIKNDSSRYFQLQFDKDEVTLYEFKSRDKYEKLNLDTLPKQVMQINVDK